MFTALAAYPFLSRYVGANNDYHQRLSLVIERLLKAQNTRGSKQVVRFTVYADVDGNSVVTLSRDLNTILAGVYLTNCTSGLCGGAPLRVDNAWKQYMVGGSGLESSLCLDSFIEMPGRYTTFLDWTDSRLLRFKFEQNETAGTMIVRGSLEGTRIYSTYSGNWIDGVAVAYTGSTTVTTTQLFDRPPTAMIKPVTKGRVSMYTVDASNVEELVAVYDPTEILPAWRRYKVPACTCPCTIMACSTRFLTRADIGAMFGDSTAIVVNQDVTHLLAPQVAYVEWNQPVTAQAGVAPYLARFVLDPSYPMDNANFRINVDLAASANPVIKIYNGVDNTVIQQINGDASNAKSFFFEALWNGTNWIKTGGYFLP